MRIRFEDMGFSYGGQGKTLNHIDLDLSEPGLVCIIGPNGVGKSTLVKCMNKLLNPTEGHVYIDDGEGEVLQGPVKGDGICRRQLG